MTVTGGGGDGPNNCPGSGPLVAPPLTHRGAARFSMLGFPHPRRTGARHVADDRRFSKSERGALPLFFRARVLGCPPRARPPPDPPTAARQRRPRESEAGGRARRERGGGGESSSGEEGGSEQQKREKGAGYGGPEALRTGDEREGKAAAGEEEEGEWEGGEGAQVTGREGAERRGGRRGRGMSFYSRKL